MDIENLVSDAPQKEYSTPKETTPLELTDYEKKVVKKLIHHIGVWLVVAEVFLVIALLLIVFFGVTFISSLLL